MLPLYDSQAPKKATNLSINSDLLSKAKEFDINLSAALEQALTQVLKQRQRDQWLKDNREAIATYNQEIEKHGTFGDELRGF